MKKLRTLLILLSALMMAFGLLLSRLKAAGEKIGLRLCRTTFAGQKVGAAAWEGRSPGRKVLYCSTGLDPDLPEKTAKKLCTFSLLGVLAGGLSFFAPKSLEEKDLLGGATRIYREVKGKK